MIQEGWGQIRWFMVWDGGVRSVYSSTRDRIRSVGSWSGGDQMAHYLEVSGGSWSGGASGGPRCTKPPTPEQ